MNYPWGHNRRFNAFSNYMKKQFGSRIQKVSVDAGFTCPNRDGTKGTGGCTFCNNNAFNPSYCNAGKTISEQIETGVKFHQKRYRKAEKYLVYFQSYSNTYASLLTLKEKYNEAFNYEGVIGLVIGTRPDCLNNEILDYLAELSETFYITLELGIESVYDETLQRVNRCHTFADAIQALEETDKRKIRTGGHFIIGLPGETREQIMTSAGIISGLNLHSVKFHQLQIFRNTPMAKEYFRNPVNFMLFEFDEYLDFMMHYIEHLNPSFVIERIAGETSPANNFGNTWNKRYDEVLRAFEHRMEIHDSWQGKKYTKI